jgi:hypothetical protein
VAQEGLEQQKEERILRLLIAHKDTRSANRRLWVLELLGDSGNVRRLLSALL